MANTPQAAKRARQADRRRENNASQRSRMRTYVKNTLKAIAAGDPATAQAAYKAAVPVIDATADKDIIHKNKAAQYKRRLNARLRAMG